MGRDKKEKESKKQKHHKHKHKKDKKKHKKEKSRKEKKAKTSTKEVEEEKKDKANDREAGLKKVKVLEEIEGEEGFAIPIELMNTKSHAPERKEDYERRQSKIRHEKDPATGRIRIIKGDGEVLEEIVSRERSRKINKSATEADGEFFQKQSVSKRRN